MTDRSAGLPTGSLTTNSSTGSSAEREEGTSFQPLYDRDGLLTCVTVDDRDGSVLMVAHMNAEALAKTLETGVAHYWSRSRRQLWRKGDTSGQVQTIVELRTDCDQDALLMRVVPGGDGGACHTGRRSCFYRVLRSDGARVDLVPAGSPH